MAPALTSPWRRTPARPSWSRPTRSPATASRARRPLISFDERYAVYHHYIGGGSHVDEDAQELGFADSNDPGFAEYTTNGASNIYILDIVHRPHPPHHQHGPRPVRAV